MGKILITLGLVFLTACCFSNPPPSPKKKEKEKISPVFKVGDCITFKTNNEEENDLEEWEKSKSYIRKIHLVGKKSYKVLWYSDFSSEYIPDVFKIGFDEQQLYTLIECPEDEV